VDFHLEPSIVGLTIQGIGVALITALSFLLTRSIRRPFLEYWTIAWACLAVALLALLAAFCLPVDRKVCQGLYFFGEYTFGYLFIAGCRNYARGDKITRDSRWGLALCGAAALAVAQLADSFTLLLVPHCAILAGFWAGGYWALRPARSRGQTSPGLRVASLALLLLTLDFLHYVPVFVYAVLTGRTPVFAYLQYSSLYDLLLEILLGFGTVLLVMESVRRELEAANRELAAAGARLRILAEQDPLTEALNRHAFYSLLRAGSAAPVEDLKGTVVLVDVDQFKAINDGCGHAAGDAALRTVAGALRSVIRAEDLLFRWGGDEFLLVLAGLAEADARVRLARMPALLRNATGPGGAELPPLSISCGVAGFVGAAALEQAIERADREMYCGKQARKRSATNEPVSASLLELA
jgi:diguanylate cyclase (GGDEF)-like protein